MKKDCSNMITFFEEKERMCKNNTLHCFGCKLSSNNNDKRMSCAHFIVAFPKEAIDIVQRWSDDNPEKTYADDFLEKFPKAYLVSRGGNTYPRACLEAIYGKDAKPQNCNSCFQCWNRTMK